MLIRQAFESSEAQASGEVLEKVAVAGERKAGDFFSVFQSMLPENVIEAATDNGQMLGVIVFSILFAIAITKIPAAEMRTIQEFFRSASDAMVIMTGWVMALAPIGVYALILPIVFATGADLVRESGEVFFHGAARRC